jgi:hypothetical protein
MLSLNNVEVIYDGVILVLKGVSLEVRDGGSTGDAGGRQPRSNHFFVNPLLCRFKSGGMGIRRRRSALQEWHDDTAMAARVLVWLPNLDPC